MKKPAAPPTGSPARRGRPKSDDLSRRLLGAAIELFARQGFEGTTTREVAALARTTERTLFQHYRSKEGLLEAVLEKAVLAHTVRESLQGLGEDIQSYRGDLEAWHRDLLRSRLAAWKEAGQLTRLLAVEMLRRPEVLERFGREWKPAAWEPLLSLFTSLRQAGVSRIDVEPAALARQFLAVNLCFLMMRAVVAPQALGDDEAEIVAVAKVFAAGALAAGRPGGLP